MPYSQKVTTEFLCRSTHIPPSRWLTKKFFVVYVCTSLLPVKTVLTGGKVERVRFSERFPTVVRENVGKEEGKNPEVTSKYNEDTGDLSFPPSFKSFDW